MPSTKHIENMRLGIRYSNTSSFLTLGKYPVFKRKDMALDKWEKLTLIGYVNLTETDLVKSQYDNNLISKFWVDEKYFSTQKSIYYNRFVFSNEYRTKCICLIKTENIVIKKLETRENIITNNNN